MGSVKTSEGSNMGSTIVSGGGGSMGSTILSGVGGSVGLTIGGYRTSGPHKSGVWLHTDIGIGSHLLGSFASGEQFEGT